MAGTLVGFSWLALLGMLALPVTAGRWFVRYLLAGNSPKMSDDFLPLSLGVVILSGTILGTVKAWEAICAVASHAATLEPRRRVPQLVACTCSFAALGAVGLILVPMGIGLLALRLLLPLKAPTVYHFPMVFLVTDCWSLGLLLCKVISRLVQTDTILHDLHRELAVVLAEMQGSLTNLFFDLQAHWRIWHGIVFPLLETVVLCLIFPCTMAHTLVQYVVPEDHFFTHAFLLMYCYHIMVAARISCTILPTARRWLEGVRQRIFDAKYLVTTELQNYHPIEAATAAGSAARQ